MSLPATYSASPSPVATPSFLPVVREVPRYHYFTGWQLTTPPLVHGETAQFHEVTAARLNAHAIRSRHDRGFIGHHGCWRECHGRRHAGPVMPPMPRRILTYAFSASRVAIAIC